MPADGIVRCVLHGFASGERGSGSQGVGAGRLRRGGPAVFLTGTVFSAGRFPGRVICSKHRCKENMLREGPANVDQHGGRQARLDAGVLGARLDRLPMSRSLWIWVGLLSLGGFFEFYDLFLTAYVAPSLVREHILTATTPGLFGTSGVAGFVAALFAGLFVGTMLFGFVADRFGRRSVFTVSLLWYAAASAVMVLQTDAFGLNLWRFIAGVGIGVELVTIDTYISELVPKGVRGRAFAVNQTVQFAAVPVVALLAWLLVPTAPFGVSGWRVVVLIGSVSAVAVWLIRRQVPESPRWLAAHGRLAEADRVVTALERRVVAETGAELALPGQPEVVIPRGNLTEALRPPYVRRTVMLVVFNIFQTVGFYGFANWVPTLLVRQGITLTSSLQYTFIIALAAPLGSVAGGAVRRPAGAQMG